MNDASIIVHPSLSYWDAQIHLPRKSPPKVGPFEGLGVVRRNGRSHRSGQMNAVMVSSWSVHGQQTCSIRSACCLYMDSTWSAHGLYVVSTWYMPCHAMPCHGQHTVTLWPAHDQYVVSARPVRARLRSAHLSARGQHMVSTRPARCRHMISMQSPCCLLTISTWLVPGQHAPACGQHT